MKRMMVSAAKYTSAQKAIRKALGNIYDQLDIIKGEIESLPYEQYQEAKKIHTIAQDYIMDLDEAIHNEKVE